MHFTKQINRLKNASTKGPFLHKQANFFARKKYFSS
uniref:Uncharacterized protein n=1 Tax=Arundo donax TaxID=35708 RepID=A0A0A9BTA5_ARUDO